MDMKKVALLGAAGLGSLAAIKSALAHCALCTGAFAVAATSAKLLGVDPSIIGVLAGAFGLSTGLWISRTIKRQWFAYQSHAIVLASFLLTFLPVTFVVKDSFYLPLLLFGEPGTLFNKVYWVNKIAFGAFLGGAATLAAYWLHVWIKRMRGGVLFPFQGIALAVLAVAAVSLPLYFAFG